MIGRLLEAPDGQPVGTGPKYLGLPGDKPISGWEEAMLHPRGVCVVEGAVDLLTLRMWGVPGVPLVGNRLRHENLVQLERFERIYVALDPDAGGQKGTQALVAHFGSRALPIELPGGHDVAELATCQDGKEQFAAAIVKAVCATPTTDAKSLTRSCFDSPPRITTQKMRQAHERRTAAGDCGAGEAPWR